MVKNYITLILYGKFHQSEQSMPKELFCSAHSLKLPYICEYSYFFPLIKPLSTQPHTFVTWLIFIHFFAWLCTVFMVILIVSGLYIVNIFKSTVYIVMFLHCFDLM